MRYDAGRDREHAFRLHRAVDIFCKSYERDLSADRRAVFLFPGGMASKLVRSGRAHADSLPHRYYLAWLGVRVLRGDARHLQIEADGSDTSGKYIIPDGPIGFPFSPYAAFVKWCKKKNVHLFVFGWDWRRGVQHSANVFLRTLMPLVESRLGRPLANYSLIGHSAGGMVVKVIANQATNRFVRNMRRAITVATPFYGCGGQPHLFFMGVPLVNATIRGTAAAKTVAKIIASMRGGYEFLYLDKATYDLNARALARDADGYNLLDYPSMDRAGGPADPFNPMPGRYPYWVRLDLLAVALADTRKVSDPLALCVAAKFFCIRGVQKKSGVILRRTVVSQTWQRVTPDFDPATMSDPIQDEKGAGDGVEAAWSARLLGLPSGHVVTVARNLKHETMMSCAVVQGHIEALIMEGRR